MEGAETPRARRSETQQEIEAPEMNLVEGMGRWFYLLGKVTRPSRMRHKAGRVDGKEVRLKRSLLSRTRRAELLERLKTIPETNRMERQEVINEARDRDEIERQYLNQGELRVDLPGMNEVSARYTVISPPERRVTGETKDLPTVFVISGIAADLEVTGGLIQELVFNGRRVVAVAYPESTMGRVSEKYVHGLKQAESVLPQTEFFKAAISELIPEDEKVELWGWSTGSAVIGEILGEENWREKIADAVLLAPAMAVGQSKISMLKGVKGEVTHLLRNFRGLAKYALIWGRKEAQTEEQDRLKGEVFAEVMDKVTKMGGFWERMGRLNEGSVLVWSGGKDKVTKTYQAESELSRMFPVKIVADPEGRHVTPVVDPARVIAQVKEARGY